MFGKLKLAVFTALSCGFAFCAAAATSCTSWTQVKNALEGGTSVTLTQNITQDGVGVTISGKTVTLDLNGYTITGSSNTGTSYRPFTLASSANFTLTDSSAAKTGTINGNSVSRSLNGGCVYVPAGCSFTMIGGTITNCKGTRGGGVYTESSGVFTMNGGSIVSCGSTGTGSTSSTAASDGGGGVYSVGTFTFNGGTIKSCTAKSGGGIFAVGPFTMNGGTVSDNTASNTSGNFSGGGIFIHGSSEATINGGSVLDNVSKGNGGGIGINTGTLNIYCCEIRNNKAVGRGGGLQTFSGKVYVYGALMSGNSLTSASDAGASGKSPARKCFNVQNTDGRIYVYGGEYDQAQWAETAISTYVKLGSTSYTSTKVGSLYVVGSGVAVNADNELTDGTYTFNPTNREYQAYGVPLANARGVRADGGEPATWTIISMATRCTDCVTFSAARSFRLQLRKDEGAPDVTLEWSKDQKEWEPLVVNSNYVAGVDGSTYQISFRGTGNTTFATSSDDALFGHTFEEVKLAGETGAGVLSCSGDVETLLDYKTVAAKGHPTMGTHAFARLFKGLTALTTLPEIKATTLAEGCCREMFANCTALEVGATQPGKEWSVPAGASAGANWSADMFAGTAGGFTGSPVVGTTYYVASVPAKVIPPPVVGTSVTVCTNGAEVACVGGEYVVRWGAEVTVVYSAVSCYRFADGDAEKTVTLTANADVNTIPESQLPTAPILPKLTYLEPEYVDNTATKGVARWVTKEITDYTGVTSETKEWSNGWYAVGREVTIDGGVTCQGNVKLILCDGARLTVNAPTDKAAIATDASGSFTVYGQEIGDGRLFALSAGRGAGIGGSTTKVGKHITINGGVITARGGERGAGIGGGGQANGEDIVINGGVVTAWSAGNFGAGIGGGTAANGLNITINGGVVTASNSGTNGAGIGGGAGSGSVGTASNIRINGGTVRATGGSNTGAIGGGANTTGASSGISIAKELLIKADSANPPTIEVDNSGSADLTKSLAGNGHRYVVIERPAPDQSAIAVAPSAEPVACGSWADLKAALESGKDARLTANVAHPGAGEGPIALNAFQRVTLDLAGHTVSGGAFVSRFVDIYAGASLTLNDSVGGGAVRAFTCRNGGAVWVGGTFTMLGGTFLDCRADNGGAVYVNAGGTFNFTDGTITNCTATSGGGAYVAGSLAMTGGTIVGNRATGLSSEYGGGGGLTVDSGDVTAIDDSGLPVDSGETVVISGGQVSGNEAVGDGATGYGGGILNRNGLLSIYGGEIQDNVAAVRGGGVQTYSGTVNFYGGVFSGNRVTTPSAGDSAATGSGPRHLFNVQSVDGHMYVYGGAYETNPWTLTTTLGQYIALAGGSWALKAGGLYVVGTGMALGTDGADKGKLLCGTFTFDPMNDVYAAAGVPLGSGASVEERTGETTYWTLVTPALCTDCLTFSAQAPFGIRLKKSGNAPTVDVEWSTDRLNWSPLALNKDYTAGRNGQDYFLYFRGTTNRAFGAYSGDQVNGLSFAASSGSQASAITCSGNLATLLDYQTVKDGKTPEMGDYAFARLFENFMTLTEIPELPKTHVKRCYSRLFAGCTALTVLPDFAGHTTAESSCAEMFAGCTGLKINAEQPGRPWTVGALAGEAPGWNYGMFSGTSGTFTDDPAVGTTYYVASAPATVCPQSVAHTTYKVYKKDVLGAWCLVPGADGEYAVTWGDTIMVVYTADACHEFVESGKKKMLAAALPVDDENTRVVTFGVTSDVTEVPEEKLPKGMTQLPVAYREPVYVDGAATNGIDRWETKTCTEYTQVTVNTTFWTNGWYVVGSDVAIKGGVTCRGDVHLILCMGARLTVQAPGGVAGIATDPNGSFTVYGEPDGGGVLVAASARNSAAASLSAGAGIGGSTEKDGKNITINGGFVSATGGDYGAGIGGGGSGDGVNITINGGVVSAMSYGAFAAGIGGGGYYPYSHARDITINGGQVRAFTGVIRVEDTTYTMGTGIGCGPHSRCSGIRINGGSVLASGGTFEGSSGLGGCDIDPSRATDIYVKEDLVIKAGPTEHPTQVIEHTSTTDLATVLAGVSNRYVVIERAQPTVAETPVASSGNTVTCATWDALKTALEKGDNVSLAADICRSDDAAPIELAAMQDVTLDLAGHEVACSNAAARFVTVFAGANFTLADSVGTGVVRGFRDVDGGAVWADGNFTLAGGTLVGCWAADCGGAIYATANATNTIAGGAIVDCFAGQSGGGVCSAGGAFLMTDGTIAENRACGVMGERDSWSAGIVGGGGLAFLTATNSPRAEICGGQVVGNEAGDGIDGLGGGILNVDGPLLIRDCDLRDNTAPKRGGALSTFTGNVTVYGMLCRGNAAAANPCFNVQNPNGLVTVFGGEFDKVPTQMHVASNGYQYVRLATPASVSNERAANPEEMSVNVGGTVLTVVGIRMTLDAAGRLNTGRFAFNPTNAHYAAWGIPVNPERGLYERAGNLPFGWEQWPRSWTLTGGGELMVVKPAWDRGYSTAEVYTNGVLSELIKPPSLSWDFQQLNPQWTARRYEEAYVVYKLDYPDTFFESDDRRQNYGTCITNDLNTWKAFGSSCGYGARFGILPEVCTETDNKFGTHWNPFALPDTLANWIYDLTRDQVWTNAIHESVNRELCKFNWMLGTNTYHTISRQTGRIGNQQVYFSNYVWEVNSCVVYNQATDRNPNWEIDPNRSHGRYPNTPLETIEAAAAGKVKTLGQGQQGKAASDAGEEVVMPILTQAFCELMRPHEATNYEGQTGMNGIFFSNLCWQVGRQYTTTSGKTNILGRTIFMANRYDGSYAGARFSPFTFWQYIDSRLHFDQMTWTIDEAFNRVADHYGAGVTNSIRFLDQIPDNWTGVCLLPGADNVEAKAAGTEWKCFDEDVYVDRGDVLLMKSLTHMADVLFRLSKAYHWAGDDAAERKQVQEVNRRMFNVLHLDKNYSTDPRYSPVTRLREWTGTNEFGVVGRPHELIDNLMHRDAWFHDRYGERIERAFIDFFHVTPTMFDKIDDPESMKAARTSFKKALQCYLNADAFIFGRGTSATGDTIVGRRDADGDRLHLIELKEAEVEKAGGGGEWNAAAWRYAAERLWASLEAPGAATELDLKKLGKRFDAHATPTYGSGPRETIDFDGLGHRKDGTIAINADAFFDGNVTRDLVKNVGAIGNSWTNEIIRETVRHRRMTGNGELIWSEDICETNWCARVKLNLGDPTLSETLGGLLPEATLLDDLITMTNRYPTSVSDLSGFAKRLYVSPPTMIPSQVALPHATAQVYDFYGEEVKVEGQGQGDGLVRTNLSATVVYTADTGYFFNGGRTVVTNRLDTTVNPAVPVDAKAPFAPNDCITFSAAEPFGIRLAKGENATFPNVEWSTDRLNWTALATGDTPSAVAKVGVYEIHFRGVGNTAFGGDALDRCNVFVCDPGSQATEIACSGNIETLLDYGTVSVDRHPVMDAYAFASLFSGFATLVDVPLLPATNLTVGCYREMFSGCTSLNVYEGAPGHPWSVPADAVIAAGAEYGQAGYWADNLFKDTVGTVTGASEIKTGKVYYIQNAPRPTVDPQDVAHTTHTTYTNEVEKVGGGVEIEVPCVVPWETEMAVVYRAEDGYVFEDGTTNKTVTFSANQHLTQVPAALLPDEPFIPKVTVTIGGATTYYPNVYKAWTKAQSGTPATPATVSPYGTPEEIALTKPLVVAEGSSVTVRDCLLKGGTGPAVVYTNGVLTLAGATRIAGNATDDGAANLFVGEGARVVLAPEHTGLEVGVTYAAVAGQPPYLTTSDNVAESDAALFTCDDPHYEVRYDDEGKRLKVVLARSTVRPEPVAQTTFVIITNEVEVVGGGEEIDVPAETETIAVYVPEDGYVFPDGEAEITNRFDTTVTPARNLDKLPPVPVRLVAETLDTDGAVVAAYTNLNEAVAAVVSNGTVRLLCDWTKSYTFAVVSDYDFDENGFACGSLTPAAGCALSEGKTKGRWLHRIVHTVEYDVGDYLGDTNEVTLYNEPSEYWDRGTAWAVRKPGYDAKTYAFCGWWAEELEQVVDEIPAGCRMDLHLTATWTEAQSIKVKEKTTSEKPQLEIKVSQEWIDTNVVTSAEKPTTQEIQKKLNETDPNGNMKWQNYVIGLQTNASVMTGAKQDDNPAIVPVVLANVQTPLEDTGYSVAYSLDQVTTNGTVVGTPGEPTTRDALQVDLDEVVSAAYYKVNVILTKNGETNTLAKFAATNTLGVLSVRDAPKLSIIGVPWGRLGDGDADIPIEDLVKTASLSVGDRIHIYRKATKAYETWTLGADGKWTEVVTAKAFSNAKPKLTLAESPKTATAARGDALWLERKDASRPVYLYGQVKTNEVVTTEVTGGAESWNLTASPRPEPLDLNEKFKAHAGGRIIVPTDGAPKNYTYKDGQWGYPSTEPVFCGEVQVGVRAIRKTDDAKIPAGTGFWYVNTNDTKVIHW